MNEFKDFMKVRAEVSGVGKFIQDVILEEQDLGMFKPIANFGATICREYICTIIAIPVWLEQK